MGKLTVIFYVFVIFVLGLFACFSLLMTTVNPAPLVTAATEAITATAAATEATTEATITEAPVPKNRVKLLGYEAGGPTTGEPPKEDKYSVLINGIDPKPFNDTDPKKPKGRRSVDQRKKNNPGVVIMKVVDSEGRPRIEIVFYPKQASNDWKMYRRNILGSKRPKTNLLRNSILNIMPDDSIVFENNQGLDRVPGDISEVTKKVFDMKNLEPNIIKKLNYNKSVTNVNTPSLFVTYPEKYTSIENPHADITTVMKKDLENTDNLLHYTTPKLNSVSWKTANIGINETETNLSSNENNLIKTPNHNEEVAEQSTVLITQFHPVDETSIENPYANDKTDMKMDFSEEVQTLSYKEVSVENTDNLIHSTSPASSNIISLNKEDIDLNKYEISTNVFVAKDLRIVLTTSNLNEGTIQPNTILMLSAAETSSIEDPYSNDTMKTEIDFSGEASNDNERLPFDTSSKSADENISTQTPIDMINEKEQSQQQSDDMYINTLLNSTIPNITVDSSNEPDIWRSVKPTINASHNEAKLLYTQDASSTAADENISTQMTIDNINEK